MGIKAAAATEEAKAPHCAGDTTKCVEMETRRGFVADDFRFLDKPDDTRLVLVANVRGEPRGWSHAMIERLRTFNA